MTPLARVLGPGLALLLAACASREEFVAPAPPGLVQPAPRAAEAEPDPDRPLTLDGAIRLALARSPDVSTARTRLETAQAAVDAARVTLRPQLLGDLSVVGGDSPSTYLVKTIDSRSLDPTTDFNYPGAFAAFEAGLTLRWNLWNGQRNQLGLWEAEAGAEAARAGVDVVRNRLAAAVASTYLSIRATEQLVEAADASVTTVEAQVGETRTMMEGGRALRSDLLSLEVRLAEARERRIRSDVARRLTEARLRHLLALPPDATMQLAPVEGVETVRAGLPPTPQEALAEAYERRPDVAAARKAIEQARISLERAERGRLPRLDLESRLYGVDESIIEHPNWFVALALTFDIYDGGKTSAAVRRARAVLEQVTDRDRKVLLDVALDVETVYLRLEEARARHEVASQAVLAAEETVRLVEQQYRGGSATVTRFLETEAAQTQARTTRIRARLDLDRAVVDAERALGRLANDDGGEQL